MKPIDAPSKAPQTPLQSPENGHSGSPTFEIESDLSSPTLQGESDLSTSTVPRKHLGSSPASDSPAQKKEGRTRIFVPLPQLTSILAFSLRHVCRIVSHGCEVRPSAHKRGGQVIREVAVDTLPPDLQAKYWQGQQRADSRGKNGVPDSACVNGAGCASSLPADCARGQRASALELATPPKVTEYRRGVPVASDGLPIRSLMIEMGREAALAEFDRKWSALCKLKAALAVAAHGERDAAARTVAKAHAINSISTLYGWRSKANRLGPAALVPAIKATEGTTSIPKPIRKALLAFWNAPLQVSFRQAHRKAEELCTERSIAAPSRYAVERFLKRRRLPKGIETAHREGKKAYSAKYLARVVRDPNQLRTNELWCGDHRIADLFVLFPGDRIGRPWTTAFLDIRSGRWVGWVVRERPTSDAVASANRRAIKGFAELAPDGTELAFEPCGLPERELIDNGKEFWGGAMATKRPELAAMLDGLAGADFTLGSRHVTALSQVDVGNITAVPYNPQSKPIEAFFSAVAPEERKLPGWCGRDAKHKPEILDKLVERRQLLTLDQYRSWLALQFHRWNHAHPVGQRAHAPMHYYADHVPTIPDDAHLDELLMHTTPLTIRNRLIEIKGLGKYAPATDADREQLAWLVGEKVIALYSRDDPETIALLSKGGRRIVCRRLAPGGDWNPSRGLEPNEQFIEVKRIQRAQRRLVRTTAAALIDGVQPRDLDSDMAWQMAARNALPPAEQPTKKKRQLAQRRTLPAPQPDHDAPRPSSAMETILDARSREREAAEARIASLGPDDE